ncbi:glutamate receptor 2.9-like [Durio zibethinus]|uniref:Glutamate receptor 2.9-like n=1 Tax=Durio zibethinus TaxID=66656 RepID=A0A6P6A4Z8_DURZI|nr:glutamate receptor 2.9-like [Durio zibethinus]
MNNTIKPHFHCLFCLFILLLDKLVVTQNTTVPVNVGVVLDFDSLVGKIGWSCINMAVSDFYATHGGYKTRLVLNARDSNEDVVGAAAAALDLIKNVEVQAIIGPTTSMQANFVIKLGNKSRVPIITFSARSPSLTSLGSSYFFRSAQSSSSQVKAISAIVKAFGWRETVAIYEDNQFGESIIPCLTESLQAINVRVPYLSVISPSATDDQIDRELYKLMAMQTRVFIVHMRMSLGSRLLAKAKEIGMMNEGYAWIVTDGMTNLWRSSDSSTIDSMHGVLGVRTYVPKLKKLEAFKVRWQRKFQQDNPDVLNAELSILGLWAYDATFALAMAIEKAGFSDFHFNKTNVSSSAVDLENVGVSQNGPQLIQALSSIKFSGLTGYYHFVNRQLHSSVFQIVNVNGNGERRIGFWTPENGLVRRLKPVNRKTSINSSSKPNLGPIIWPGDTTIVPRGWDNPRNGSKLRIGVPVNNGFSEFVKVTWDPISQKATLIEGYCIDVFAAVMAKMPYAVPYEFIPFATPEGKSAGSYNDLIDQVHYGNYDAVVGDTTIVANRSLYVDFTMPYTESGVSMIVPIRDNREKNPWVFLKPLTWDLWVASGCFFLFIGFVVWVLEHRINQDFRGSPAHQVGTMIWFSLSTIVFSHRERVVSNLARFVIIIWCFVVLILIQSYTASLTSLLTIKQLQPTVTDINELLKRRESVGYRDGSFVEGILMDLKFHKFQLKKYKSPDELDELFTKGSANGGISAALDEVPLIELFLAKYCGKYTMVEPTFKTAGFGFVSPYSISHFLSCIGFLPLYGLAFVLISNLILQVFPKGSPLVVDVSRGILNVTQSDEINQIEDKWFKKETVCLDRNVSISSNSLGLESFSGLFLIAGTASLLALVIFVAMFLYEQRHVFLQFDPETPIWRRIHTMSRFFDQKDLSSRTSTNDQNGEGSYAPSVQSTGFLGGSPNTNCPPSPSSCSNQTNSLEFVFLVQQESPPVNVDLTPSGSATPEIFPSPERSIELAN